MTALRHLLAILILPFTVTVLVPLWLADEYALRVALEDDPIAFATRLGGVVVALIGVVLVVSSIRRFAREGRGTLAPWDPPRALVVRGPYAFVRHPMISGVLLILLGESIGLRSAPHALWTLTVLALNLLYIPLIEEPMLSDRFGDAYDEYRRHVPGLFPRATPWRPEAP
jgi:protein-S-isoprenylcysteine O-methyltransferase Ste14